MVYLNPHPVQPCCILIAWEFNFKINWNSETGQRLVQYAQNAALYSRQGYQQNLAMSILTAITAYVQGGYHYHINVNPQMKNKKTHKGKKKMIMCPFSSTYCPVCTLKGMECRPQFNPSWKSPKQEQLFLKEPYYQSECDTKGFRGWSKKKSRCPLVTKAIQEKIPVRY